MSISTTTKRSDLPPDGSIPPLEPGDHLTREEFERRYDAMPDLKKAELIEGVVHMPSPVRWMPHGSPHSKLNTWLGVYELYTPGVDSATNSSIRLDIDNEPQPDVAMIIQAICGGRARFDTKQYLVAAPELAAEISASTVSFDLHQKFRVYGRAGVLEYLIWRVADQAIDWFVLRRHKYEPLVADAAGILRSEVFPGLWLDAAALTRLELARVHAVLQQGLASPEHQAFVARLQQAGAQKR